MNTREYMLGWNWKKARERMRKGLNKLQKSKLGKFVMVSSFAPLFPLLPGLAPLIAAKAVHSAQQKKQGQKKRGLWKKGR